MSAIHPSGALANDHDPQVSRAAQDLCAHLVDGSSKEGVHRFVATAHRDDLVALLLATFDWIYARKSTPSTRASSAPVSNASVDAVVSGEEPALWLQMYERGKRARDLEISQLQTKVQLLMLDMKIASANFWAAKRATDDHIRRLETKSMEDNAYIWQLQEDIMEDAMRAAAPQTSSSPPTDM
jgi:hypothetical protein